MSRSFIALLVLVLALGAPFPGEASPIYVIKERDGSIRFTTRKPSEGVKAEVFTAKSGRYSRYKGKYWQPRIFAKSKFDPLIKVEATRKGLDPSLVKAVIHAESAFDPWAKSPKGAMGLMQLMPDTARLVGVRNAYEPAQNIRGGVTYLAMMHRRFGGNLDFMLAAYNAGPGAVDQYGGIPPYRETQEYVRRVQALFQLYRARG